MIIFGNRAHYSAIGGVENSLRSLLKVAADQQSPALMVCRVPLANEALDAASMDLPAGIELTTYADEYLKHPLRRLLFLPRGGESLRLVYLNLFTLYPGALVIVRHHMHVLAADAAGFKDIRYLVPSLTVNQLREDLGGLSGIRWLKTRMHMLVDGWLQSKALGKAKLFVFSLSMQQQVRQNMPKAERDSPITMVSPGIDAGRFNSADHDEKRALRLSLNLPVEQKLLLFVGRFVQAKGLDYLLDALALMPLGCALVLVGEGDRELLMRGRVKYLGLANRVLFAGTTSSPEDYYRACDLFVMSSTYEPLGQTILEAAACGMRLAAFSREAGVDTATQELGLDEVVDYAIELSAESLGKAMKQSLNKLSEQVTREEHNTPKQISSWATLLDQLTR